MCKTISIWLRNKLKSAGSEPVLSHIEMHVSNRIIFSFLQGKIKMYNPNNKTGFNIIIIAHFHICGKLFIIRCDKKKTIIGTLIPQS